MLIYTENSNGGKQHITFPKPMWPWRSFLTKPIDHLLEHSSENYEIREPTPYHTAILWLYQ